MGISAAVVYDIRKKTTVILRTSASSRKQRHEALDTVASFSQHCESIRGIAQSVTEVSAQWGGPPYVTYNVVASRFRVIIIWDEGPADINVAYDVYHSVIRLQDVVGSAVDGLIEREPTTMRHVYEEAGNAIRLDEPFVLPAVPTSPTRTKLLSMPSRRASTAQSDTSTTKKSIFGKIGTALRTSPKVSNVQRKTEEDEKPTTNYPVFGPDGALDDAEGPLALPEDVFEWCYFGTSLHDDPGNLDWFAHLFQAAPFVAPSPSTGPFKSSFPALRAGSASSTPLTVPSSSVSLAPQASGPSSVEPSLPVAVGTAQNQSTESSQSKPMTTDQTPSSNKKSNVPTPVQSSAGISSSEQRSSHPVQAQASITPVQSPSVQSPPPSATGQTPIASFSPMQRQQQQLQQQLEVKRQQLLQQQQTIQEHALQMQQQSIQIHSQPQTQSQQFSQRHQIPQQQQQLQPQPQQQQQQQQSMFPNAQHASSPSAQASVKADDNALPNAPNQRTNDFDVSQLGDYKDAATTVLETASRSGNVAEMTAADLKKIEDDAIRTRMNEFANSMQSGSFTVALRQVYDTLRFLCRIEPLRTREIVTCSNYVLAQKILIRNAVLEQELTQVIFGSPASVQRQVESSLLTMFLAELKHLLPRHRVAAMRVAVEKNIRVGNYGMSARWLKQLVEKAPEAQKQTLRTQLQTCVANGERNAHMPPTNRLCYTTLRVLTSRYAACNVCTAVYHPTLSGLAAGNVCGTCFVGTIYMKN